MKDLPEKLAELDEAPPSKLSLPLYRALLWHGLGFLTIVLLLWADELFAFLYNYFGGDWRQVELTDAAIRSVVVIFIWIFFARKIHEVLSRLTYLESFMHFCSWCSKVEKDNEWLTLEELFLHDTGKRPSHGMCPDCARKFLDVADADKADQSTLTRK